MHPWILALHIISIISWMAALFYLPRLFVYHCEAMDLSSSERFKTMEKKLFFIIASPAAILAAITGFALIIPQWDSYEKMWWLDIKLILVLLLVIFHFTCWKYMNDFKHNRNHHSGKFYRMFNEIPTLLMCAIVILVTVKPF